MNLRNLTLEGGNLSFQHVFYSFQVTNSQLQFPNHSTLVYEFALNSNLPLTLKSRVPHNYLLGANLKGAALEGEEQKQEQE